jgi:hypothetical protein
MIGNPLLLPTEGYEISRSVRLRSSASAYLSRTPASASNRKTWTWSGWVKRGALTTDQRLFEGYVDTSNWTTILFEAADKIQIAHRVGGTSTYNLVTTAVYRDPSAWYHIVVAFDTTQATSADRVKLYVNGTQITVFTTNTIGAQNVDTFVDATNVHHIGRYGAASQYFDGYLTEVNFIDGQALTPSSFGETDAITGVWKPKKYSGTYGTNGFYLNFSDNSNNSSTTIGKDYSGNGNNWTPNNISVTSGVTYDSMLDVPTLWADGGNGRGNYAVMNPVDKHASLPAPTNGNLSLSNAASAWFAVRSTVAVTSGKWYAEITQTGSNSFAGVMSGSSALTFASKTGSTGIYGFFNDGAGTSGYPHSNGTSGTVFTIASGDVIGLAYDYDAQTVAIYRNGSLQATVTSVPKAEPMFFCAAFAETSATHSWNFGQRPFAYTPPTGFKALNTQNLPEQTIKKGNAYFDATLYTGTGSAQSIVNSGAMQPDFVWTKSRSASNDHILMDSVRGLSVALFSNLTNAEVTDSTRITSLNANGFTLGTSASTNQNAVTFVGWQWNAGGSTVTNTSGSISAQVRANATAGFSVVTYTGTGANATVGHGLGVAPSMIITKVRSTSGADWGVYHTSIGNTKYLFLNTTAASATSVNFWNNTSPTSAVFSVGISGSTNNSGNTMVAYCFAAVAGYSAFGSYTGNGSTDGPFIYLGFRPRFFLAKVSSGTTGSWHLIDTSRSPYNEVGVGLYPNSSNAESSDFASDILSNGLKMRNTQSELNGSGNTYIYMAFAENPFKLSPAR